MERYRPDITDPKVMGFLKTISEEFGTEYLKTAVQMGLRRSLPEVIEFLRGSANPQPQKTAAPVQQPTIPQATAKHPLQKMGLLSEMTDEDFQ